MGPERAGAGAEAVLSRPGEGRDGAISGLPGRDRQVLCAEYNHKFCPRNYAAAFRR